MREVPSPCISICTYNQKGYCLGCKRSKEEIENWMDYTNDEKKALLKELKRRNISDTDYYGYFG